MSRIDNFNDYANQYNTRQDFSSLFSGMNTDNSSSIGSNILSDYASIKNGSYGKLMKFYYAKQDYEKAALKGDTKQRSVLIRDHAESLKRSAEALQQDSLWEKKTFSRKNEETGETEEVEDYDWEAIGKAVKSFVDDYNALVKQAGESDVKEILRNGKYMTNSVAKSEKLLSQIGITKGSGNQLKLDEAQLKKADINTMKTLFYGHLSLADKVAQKADAFSKVASKNAGIKNAGTYTSSGKHSDVLSKLVSEKIDKEV